MIQLGSQSVSGHSKLHRERESYIKVRSLESAHLNASVSNQTREHICVYQIRFWQPGIQQKHLFLCMMFFVQEGRTKTSPFSLGLLLLQPSELKERQYCKETPTFAQPRETPQFIYLNGRSRSSIFSWHKGCEEKRSLLCSTWSDQAGAPPVSLLLCSFSCIPLILLLRGPALGD